MEELSQARDWYPKWELPELPMQLCLNGYQKAMESSVEKALFWEARLTARQVCRKPLELCCWSPDHVASGLCALSAVVHDAAHDAQGSLSFDVAAATKADGLETLPVFS